MTAQYLIVFRDYTNTDPAADTYQEQTIVIAKNKQQAIQEFIATNDYSRIIAVEEVGRK